MRLSLSPALINLRLLPVVQLRMIGLVIALATLAQVAGPELAHAQQPPEPPRQIEIDTLEQSRRQADAAERGLPLAERAAVAGEDAAKAARDAVRAADDATKVARDSWKAAKDSAHYAKLSLVLTAIGIVVSAFAAGAVVWTIRSNRQALALSQQTLEIMKADHEETKQQYLATTRPRLLIIATSVSGTDDFGHTVSLTLQNTGQTSALDISNEFTAQFTGAYSSEAPFAVFSGGGPLGHLPPQASSEFQFSLGDGITDTGELRAPEGSFVRCSITTTIMYKAESGKSYSIDIELSFMNSDRNREYDMFPDGESTGDFIVKKISPARFVWSD